MILLTTQSNIILKTVTFSLRPMAKCLELNEMNYKIATSAHMAKCIELQEISSKTYFLFVVKCGPQKNSSCKLSPTKCCLGPAQTVCVGMDVGKQTRGTLRPLLTSSDLLRS